MAARTSNAEASAGFLSAVDDLMTRLLLDGAIFHEKKYVGRCTGKIDLVQRHLRARTEKGKEDTEEEDVQQLVQQVRTGDLTVNDALSAFLKLPSVENYNLKWSGEAGAEAMLANHAKRFLLAFRPDSGIAFHETDRYTNPSAAVAGAMGKGKKKSLPASVKAVVKVVPKSNIEVGVFATKAFKKGDVIQLRGALAELTDEEDDKLRDGKERSEFSVLWSERKKCYNLLLGPARFVNHCCRNNVVFLSSGANMTFKVIEDIEPDEEIFTHYGDHYFDEDNRSCLCTTCEQLQRGAFAPSAPKQPAKAARASLAPSTPSRRTGRSLSNVNYDEDAPIASTSSGTGHALTAQRSLRGGMTRSSSLPNLSTAASSKRLSSPRGTPARSLPSRISIIDTLRGQPRTVIQPKLRPPPGYIDDYSWDPKTKQAVYEGPTTLEEITQKPELTRSASETALGKRKRGADDSPKPPKPRWKGWVVIEEPLPAEEVTAREERARKYQEQKEKKANKVIRTGKRASARVSLAAAQKEKKKEADGNASSDLSDVEDSEDVEEESDAEMEDAEVAAMLSPAKTSTASGSPAPRRSSRIPSPSEPLFTLPGYDYSRRPAVAVDPAVPSTSDTTSLTLVATRTTRSSRASTSQLSALSSCSAVAPRHLAIDVLSTSTPIEETHSPELQMVVDEEKKALPDFSDDEESEYDNVILLPVPAKKELDDNSPRPSPRRSIGAPPVAFYSASSGGEGGGAGAGAANGAAPSSTSNGQDFRVCPPPLEGGHTRKSCPFEVCPPSNGGGRRSPTGLGGGGGGIGGGGGGGGGGDDGREGGDRRPLPVDKMDVDVEEEEEEKKPVIDAKESGKGVEASATEVQGADDDQEGVAALLMLLAAPLSNSSAQSPSPAAPTPPQAESSAASTSNSNDAAAAPVETESAVKKGKRKRVSDISEPEPTPPPSLNPRSTRRQPKLPPPPPEEDSSEGEPEEEFPEGPPEASTSVATNNNGNGSKNGTANGQSKKARTSNSPAIVVSAPPTRSSRPRSSAVSQAPPPDRDSPSASPSHPPPPPAEPRRTRSKPIAGKLEDVLYSSATLAALGGYDHEKGRYISKHEALRSPSNNPLPRPRSPSPPVASTSKSTKPASSFAKPSSSSAKPADAPAIKAVRSNIRLPRPNHDASVVFASRIPVASTSRIPIASTSRSTPLASISTRRGSTGGLPPPSSSRRGSTSGGPPPVSTPVAPPEGVRSTRRSFPIAQSMRDFIYSPAIAAVSGGWDADRERYVSASSAAAPTSSTPVAPPARRASSSSAVEPSLLSASTSSSSKKKRALSNSPAIANGSGSASSSAPPEGTRSTRRSFPMAQTSLQDLVYGNAARSATGGWDEELGRYVSAAAAAKAAAKEAAEKPPSKTNGKRGGKGR